MTIYDYANRSAVVQPVQPAQPKGIGPTTGPAYEIAEEIKSAVIHLENAISWARQFDEQLADRLTSISDEAFLLLPLRS